MGNKAVIVPLDVSVECMFEQLGDMIYSRTTIDKQMFKLVHNCKCPLKSGNRLQSFPIWDDNSVYRILNMVNTIGIEEIELYIEVVQVKPQVNQSVGGHIDLLVHENYNVAEFDYGCGPSSGSVPNTRVYGDDEDYAYEEANDEFDEDVDDESNGDLDVQMMDMYHSSRLSTKFWRMRKGYMSLCMQHLVMYQITQMLRNQMSHPLFIITYHQHLNLNMLKT